MYTKTIDKIVFNGFEPGARDWEYTMYSASQTPTALQISKNHY